MPARYAGFNLFYTANVRRTDFSMTVVFNQLKCRKTKEIFGYFLNDNLHSYVMNIKCKITNILLPYVALQSSFFE